MKRGLLGKTTVHSNSIQLLRIVCEMFAMEVYTALCQGLQNGWDSNIQQFIVLLALKSTMNIFVAIEMFLTVNVYIPSLLGILF